MWDFLSRPAFQRLALTLVHFLWQGAALAFLASILLRSLGRRNSQVRYAVCAAALIVLIACPSITFFVVGATPADSSNHHFVHSASVAPESGETQSETDVAGFDASPTSPVDEPSSLEPTNRGRVEFEAALAKVAPYLILCWMVGVVCFGLRLLLGFVGVRRLLRERFAPTANLTALLAAVCRRLQFSAVPRIACSRRIAEAMVVGFFRPVILLPVAWATQMPVEVLQSVLAHELAHIRRRDQWANLLQRVAEVLLFYHPAVWWISRRMRAEREFCCDELAATAAGGAVQYAEALETVGRLRVDERTPLLSTTIGGTNMALLSRVKNVLGKPGSRNGRDGWTIGLMAVCIPLMICVSAAWWPTAQAGEIAVAFDDGDERDEDGDRERARDNDRRERGERERSRRSKERERVERERDEKRERGERRERDERRERGDREREERGHQDRDRKERDGDRRREGDRERGERRHDGDRRKPGPRRDAEGRPDKRRDIPRGDRRPGGDLRELMNLIRDLRNEVHRLRKDVDALKRARGIRGDGPRRRSDADRGDSSRPGDRDRNRAGRGDQPPRRNAKEPRKDDRPRESDRPRKDDRPRRPDGEPRQEGARDSDVNKRPREGDRNVRR